MSKELVVIIEVEGEPSDEKNAHITDALNETFYTLEASGYVYDWRYLK